MSRWEYRILRLDPEALAGDGGEDPLVAKLNRLGQAEWELISGFQAGADQGYPAREVVLVFKRRIG